VTFRLGVSFDTEADSTVQEDEIDEFTAALIGRRSAESMPMA